MKQVQIILVALLVVLLVGLGLSTSGPSISVLTAVIDGHDPISWNLLAETYAGIALFSVWMFAQETSTVRALLWLTFFVLFGNIGTITYALVKIRDAGGAAPKDLLLERIAGE